MHEQLSTTSMIIRLLRAAAAIACCIAASAGQSQANELDRQIAGLESAFAQYQQLDRNGGWPQILGVREVLPVDEERMRVLHARLVAEGYVTKESAFAGPETMQAIREFQRRHGLVTDGRVGVTTLTQLNIPASFRVGQLQSSLFRWKSMSRSSGGLYVIVNTAALTLGVWRGAEKVLEMKAVAGAPSNPTPVFSATITGVTVNPAWTIPYSIASREILPRLRKNAGYLAENDIAIVGREFDKFGLLIDWGQVSSGRFTYQLRQAPGPKNPLGRIKFEMPNAYDIYLHDTPSKQAFGRSERWLSHGCIRLENPLTLAAELASRQSAADIRDTLAAGETANFPVEMPVPVHIVYGTAFLDHTGALNFRRDVYGWDSVLGLVTAAPQPECRQGGG